MKKRGRVSFNSPTLWRQDWRWTRGQLIALRACFPHASRKFGYGTVAFGVWTWCFDHNWGISGVCVYGSEYISVEFWSLSCDLEPIKMNGLRWFGCSALFLWTRDGLWH